MACELYLSTAVFRKLYIALIQWRSRCRAGLSHPVHSTAPSLPDEAPTELVGGSHWGLRVDPKAGRKVSKHTSHIPQASLLIRSWMEVTPHLHP